MIRTNLIRELHALGKSLGLDHEALRDACGVSSLRELRDNELLAHIRRLRSSVEAKPAGPRLVNTPHALATIKQRRTIHALFRSLGWPQSQCDGWLERRYGLLDLWDQGNADFTVGVASQIISALKQAQAKGAGGRAAKEIACT